MSIHDDEEFSDDDYDDSYDDESDDDRRAIRGTSECDGLCDPQCAWCLVAHLCPDDCAGGECPYEALAKRKAGAS